MRNLCLILLSVFCFCFAKAQQQEIPVVKYEALDALIQKEGRKLVVVNFWSTTCAPCVKELPEFMEVNEAYRSQNDFKMILVSLDRPKDMERVKKFISDKKLTAEVVILDDIKRMNTWIPHYEEKWMGEIPVTLFYKNGEKVHFHDGEMSKNELQSVITSHIN